MLRIPAVLLLSYCLLWGAWAEAGSLQPFAEYKAFVARWKTLDDATIESFIHTNQDYVVSNDLRRKWLHRLVKRSDWKRFDAHYDAAVNDVELECHFLARRLRSGKHSQELQERSQKIWLSSRDLPDSCTPLFMGLRKAGLLNASEVWERIRLAFKADQLSLARYLAQTYLGPKDRLWVRRWRNARKHPRKTLHKPNFPLKGKHSAEILLDTVERVARQDPQEAETLWQHLAKQKSSLAKQTPHAYAAIGYQAAINQHPDATQWLQRASFDEERVRHWAMRAALYEGQWQVVLDFFKRLTEEERSLPSWRYWQARALAATGKKTKAKQVYQEIAGERDYYSFLAADQVDAPYQMNDRPIQAATQALAESRAFQIARELAAAGDLPMMRRQWAWALRNLEGDRLLAAAKLAQQWSLHDRAIVTAGRAKYYDDVELRFPLLHEEAIRRQAIAHQVPITLIYGVIRQESAFMVDARSPAGALGLMQIMPATGRVIAKKQKRRFRRRQLLDPEINIDMGTFYLQDLLGRFYGNYAMVIAGYNAGPLRPEQWRRARPIDADVWIETIPFKETRNYVKSVLSYQAIYRHRIGLPHEPISKDLMRIPGGA